MGIDEIRKLKGVYQIVKKSGGSVKPKNKIRFRAKKMVGKVKVLRQLVIKFLSVHKMCKIQGPECTKEATCVHHSEGRIGDKLLDVSTFIPSCSNCNLWCETHDAEARKKGFKKSKFTKK